MKLFRWIPGLAFASVLVSSCALVRVDSEGGPPRLESDGLVDGHFAVGFNDEDRIFHANLFDGRSRGAIGEIVIWKLFRLEVGLAGVAIGVGPLDAALGVLFYNPRMPDYPERGAHDEGGGHEASIEEASAEHDK